MTLDRFRAASVFFDVKFPPYLAGHLDPQKWISWGALSAIASIPEIFERELDLLAFGARWRSSPERDRLRSSSFGEVWNSGTSQTDESTAKLQLRPRLGAEPGSFRKKGADPLSVCRVRREAATVGQQPQTLTSP